MYANAWSSRVVVSDFTLGACSTDPKNANKTKTMMIALTRVFIPHSTR